VSTAKKLDQKEEIIIPNAEYFASICLGYFESLLNIKFEKSSVLCSSAGVFSNKNIFVSILYTGTVYGEYILALDRELACKMVNWMRGDDSSSVENAEIVEVLAEFLNIAVGQSVVSLTKNFEKLTITAPKVFFGVASYPKVTTGKVTLKSDHGEVECLLYVDQMKLDIAESYKAALSNLTKTNTDLVSALGKLQAQQEVIVQMEKQSALGTMAAGVAHELNTPLTTIKLVSEKIRSLVSENDVNRVTFFKSVDTIDSTVERISKITTNLRIFAKGLQSEPSKLVAVDKLVSDSIVLLSEELKSKSIHVALPLSQSPILVNCRPSEISTVIYSLVVNSIEILGQSKDKWIKIEAVETNKNVVIKIVDSGKGIAKDIAAKMFDPFFTTKDFGQGPGLGLSVAKSILEGHKGDIKYDQETKNTTFEISLPK
jgi:signal transduction histidine kinase